jgi:hypothetical protein
MVCRFSTPSSVHHLFGVLRDAGQARPRLNRPQPSAGREVDGFAKRPNDRPGRPEDVASVPRPSASDLVLRRRERPAVCVLDQQLHPARTDDRETLQSKSRVAPARSRKGGLATPSPDCGPEPREQSRLARRGLRRCCISPGHTHAASLKRIRKGSHNPTSFFDREAPEIYNRAGASR